MSFGSLRRRGVWHPRAIEMGLGIVVNDSSDSLPQPLGKVDFINNFYLCNVCLISTIAAPLGLGMAGGAGSRGLRPPGAHAQWLLACVPLGRRTTA